MNDFQPCLSLIPLYLVDSWLPRVGAHIDDVDAGGEERRQDEAVAVLGRIPKAATAGVPSRVVQLILHMGHVQTVDDLCEQQNQIYYI